MNQLNTQKTLVLFLLCVLANNASAEIYKWVDAQGKTHYGDKPVENSEQLEVDIRKKGNITTSNARTDKRQKLLQAYNEDRQRENKELAEQRKQRKKNERGCVLAKDRLRHYERARSLYKLDKDGNRVIISNDVRQNSTMALRAKIKKLCR